jgi:AcrR family transcriptional regulator
MAGKQQPKRPALSRELIELAALELIEAEGLEGFSIRKLAKSLKCEAMSLYHHFPSKAEIFDALVDRLVRSFEFPSGELSPRQYLRALAQEWRRIARRYPHFFPFFSLHRLNSEDGVALLDRIAGALLDMGLPQETAARFFRVVNYYLIGAALDETSGYAKGASSLHPVAEQTIAKSYPFLHQISPFFADSQFDTTFEFGLSLILGEQQMKL